VIEAVAALEDDELCRKPAGEAERAAHAIADPLRRPEALAMAAAAVAAAGDRDRALALITAAEDADRDAAGAGGYFRDRARAGIVKALLAAGWVDRAERRSRLITAHAYYQGHAMAMIVGVMAGAGNPAGAKRLAEEIREPHSRVEALAELAAVAAAYDPEHAASLVRRAESVADQISSGDQRSRRLGKLASRVTETGGGAAAVPVRLLAKVIDSEGWPDVLPAVGRIAPAALFPLSDTVLAFARRVPPEYQ
jgi:hypothetical protein